MAATYRSSSLTLGATGAEPTGAASGDMLIAFAVATSGNPGVTANGWTLVQQVPCGPTPLPGAVFARVRGGSAPSYDLSSCLDGVIYAVIVIAVQGSDGVVANIKSATTDSGGSQVASLAGSSVTMTNPNGCLISCCSFVVNSSDATKPASMTEAQNGGAGTFAAAYQNLVSSGATGTKTWTVSPDDYMGIASVGVESTESASSPITGKMSLMGVG